MIPIGDEPGRRYRFPFVMLGLIALNVLAFVYELSLGPGLEAFVTALGVVPAEYTTGRDLPPPAPGPLWITLFTSMFLHGGFLHIASNLLYLYIFGDNVEDRFGHLPFLVFYLACGVLASLTHILFNAQSTIPSVGASGAIAGVLAAYLVLFPQAVVRTLLFIGPLFTVTRVSALLLIGFWFITQLLAGIAAIAPTEQTAGVAYWAHVGGFVAGLVIALVLRGTGVAREYRRYA